MATEQKSAVVQEINKAIAAHATWKEKLKATIHDGARGLSLDTASRDDQCEFGRWLNGSAELRAAGHYARVKELHRKFHAEVGNVLKVAMNGDRAKAEAMLDPGAAFATTSRDLTLEMMHWSREGQ